MPGEPRPESRAKRFLIFIVAYEAEGHIADVFERIPWSGLPEGCEVLVIDDASSDATFGAAQRAAADCPIPVRVWKNPRNVGYGGNQKLGYQSAIEEGFEGVVLLHGDGQYAPEKLPEMLAGLAEANVVLGSRMLKKEDALKGGMPLYKWIGNQVLTRIENAMLGTTLSEFHTGYRAYRTSALRAIPFALNTNDFHFDTDILIQFVRTGAKILEIPIPTFYGGEVCRVDGWRYFFDCVTSCWQDWLTRRGIFYCRKFDFFRSEGRYETKFGLAGSSHDIALRLVPEKSRVLDVGGGSGWVADQLSREKQCTVTVLDAVFRESPPLGHECIAIDLAEPLLARLPDADVVLLLDVVEHLPRTAHVALLDALRERFSECPPKFLISVPNTAFLPVRLSLMFLGRLNYGRRGILDETHAFLFTRRSLGELMESCGYDITKWHFTPAPYPLAFGDHLFARWLMNVNAFLAGIFPGVFAYQSLIEAIPRPTVSTLIRRSFENRPG